VVARLRRDSPERDEVALISKRHDPLRIVLRHWKQRLQDPLDPLAQAGREPFKYQMGVLLGHRRAGVRTDVVTQHDVVQRHGQRGTVGEVRDDERVGNTAVLVDYHEVGDTLGVACGDEVADDRVAAVESVGIGEDEAEFLGGGCQRESTED
jgi:hypothetical protein